MGKDRLLQTLAGEALANRIPLLQIHRQFRCAKRRAGWLWRVLRL